MVIASMARAAISVAVEGSAEAGRVPGAGIDPNDPIRSALAKGGYPWYDAEADAVRPVWPPREPDFSWLPAWRVPGLGSAGDLIVIGLAMLALAVLIVVLVELWRRYRPGLGGVVARGGVEETRVFGVAGLPEGVRPETTDPWAEALRCRERGDLAGAIVCLFAHQILTLDRLRLVRLVPGRTGRQLVRGIGDPEFRAGVEPTLRLFEAVYYGHRAPTREAFEAAWASSEAFERRAGQGTLS